MDFDVLDSKYSWSSSSLLNINYRVNVYCIEPHKIIYTPIIDKIDKIIAHHYISVQRNILIQLDQDQYSSIAQKQSQESKSHKQITSC